MLQWNLSLQQFQFVSQPLHANINHTSPIAAMKCYDLTGIPGDFLLNDNYVNQIRDAIEKIQNREATKQDISEEYMDFYNIVIGEMNEKVEFQNVHIRNDLNKRRKHVKKPYWNDNLKGVYKEFRDLDILLLVAWIIKCSHHCMRL